MNPTIGIGIRRKGARGACPPPSGFKKVCLDGQSVTQCIVNNQGNTLQVNSQFITKGHINTSNESLQEMG